MALLVYCGVGPIRNGLRRDFGFLNDDISITSWPMISTLSTKHPESGKQILILSSHLRIWGLLQCEVENVTNRDILSTWHPHVLIASSFHILQY